MSLVSFIQLNISEIYPCYCISFSFFQLSSNLLYRYTINCLFVFLLIDIYFLIGAIMNKAVRNILYKYSTLIGVIVLGYIHLQMELLAYTIGICINSSESAKFFTRVATPSYAFTCTSYSNMEDISPTTV